MCRYLLIPPLSLSLSRSPQHRQPSDSSQVRGERAIQHSSAKKHPATISGSIIIAQQQWPRLHLESLTYIHGTCRPPSIDQVAGEVVPNKRRRATKTRKISLTSPQQDPAEGCDLHHRLRAHQAIPSPLPLIPSHQRHLTRFDDGLERPTSPLPPDIGVMPPPLLRCPREGLSKKRESSSS